MCNFVKKTMEKLTKIVATIAGNKCDKDFLQSLYNAGVNAIRINTAHQDITTAFQLIDNVRSVSDKIPIIIDTKGPEVRTIHSLKEFSVSKGDQVIVKGFNNVEENSIVYVNYKDFCKFLSINDKILIDDGLLELLVIEKKNDSLICRAENSGLIKAKKSINVPNINLNLPSLNKLDKEYIKFCATHDIEFIAHSFVRNKEDIFAVQKELNKYDCKTKIIAKIENQEGVNNIDEILSFVYGVMIARGDLAVEIPAERIPVIQKQIIHKCIKNRKVVIVATQMLHSMIENPRPTRAEIADIANAIFSGADALMLSGETAYGKYPLEAVGYMSKTAIEVEKNREVLSEIKIVPIDNEVSSFLAKMAVSAIKKLDIQVIICDTHTGKTARYISAYRGGKPIFAQCYNHRTKKELALNYGVFSEYLNENQSKTDFRKITLTRLLNQKELFDDDLVVILAGNFGRQVGPSFVEIISVKNLLF